MRTLSKSKLLAYRQCAKRLWLEIHHPELREESAATQASFATGHQVGDIAHQIYDPENAGQLIDPQTEGFAAAFKRSLALLGSRQPIFEAGFKANGALAFADVMLPVEPDAWRMVEVKSSTSVKDYHRDDAAVQAYIARSAGVPLKGISLAHIDSQWVYPGNGNYQGLLVEEDLTSDAFSREAEVTTWLHQAHAIADSVAAPDIQTGAHCSSPYECGFLDYCQSQEPQAEHPIAWLPGRLRDALKSQIDQHGWREMADVPDDLLNERQQRVKSVTLSGVPYFDARGAADALSNHALPAYFMDFETIQFAVPIWAGTRPYRQIPFQFSVHTLSDTGELGQHAFLDLSGNDPSEGFAEALIAACGTAGPVFVYNAGFETARIRELAERFPLLAKSLLAINDRVVDLLPIARDFFYHPSQQGSWSIKKILPAACPDLRYDSLTGVQDGGMAMAAYLEAIAPATHEERKREIREQLLSYCGLDTYAMVEMSKLFNGSAPQGFRS